MNEDFRKEIEPNASTYKDRIASLKALHDAGCKTWVSIEPYPTPNFVKQDIRDILEAVSFTNKIIFGRLHYNKKVSAYKDYKQFFNETANTVIDFCKSHNIAFHIKTRTITD